MPPSHLVSTQSTLGNTLDTAFSDTKPLSLAVSKHHIGAVFWPALQTTRENSLGARFSADVTTCVGSSDRHVHHKYNTNHHGFILPL
jgi:hypothetical protein